MTSNLEYYLEQLEMNDKDSHAIRAHFSYKVLENVDEMIEAFKQEKPTKSGNVLLNVFGLLQGLFVGIDALYDLTIGLTRFKYQININKNPVLHELKYIRNDIVGHPTHRTYDQGRIGFSRIQMEDLSVEKISYQTYIYQKGTLSLKTKTVFFDELMAAFKKEKETILLGVVNYLNQGHIQTSLPELIMNYYETQHADILKEIRALFIQNYGVDTESNHRFLWRLSLLEIPFDDVDKRYEALVSYARYIQIVKLLEMTCDLEKRACKLPYMKLPKVLDKFYKYVHKHPELSEHFSYLNDYHHPLFALDLDYLLTQTKASKETSDLLEWFSTLKDESRVYMIGALFRAYRRKM